MLLIVHDLNFWSKWTRVNGDFGRTSDPSILIPVLDGHCKRIHDSTETSVTLQARSGGLGGVRSTTVDDDIGPSDIAAEVTC